VADTVAVIVSVTDNGNDNTLSSGVAAVKMRRWFVSERPAGRRRDGWKLKGG